MSLWHFSRKFVSAGAGEFLLNGLKLARLLLGVRQRRQYSYRGDGNTLEQPLLEGASTACRTVGAAPR
jgi:hypothetical protein